MKTKKEFFLKNWIVLLFAWLDKKIFKINVEDGGEPLSITAWWVLLEGLAVGFIIGGVSTFVKKPDTIMSIAAGAGLVIALALAVLYLVRTLSSTTGTWAKIGRSAYVIAISLLLSGFGMFLGAWAFIIVIVVFVGWIILFFIGGGSSSSKGKEWRLDSGVIVREHRDVTGTPYYEGNDGLTYTKNSDGTFSPQ